MPSPLDDVFGRFGLTMSIEECAEVLSVEPQQVRRRLRLSEDDPRRIPGYRPGGGKWVLYTAEIREYVEASAGHRDPAETPDLAETPEPAGAEPPDQG